MMRRRRLRRPDVYARRPQTTSAAGSASAPAAPPAAPLAPHAPMASAPPPELNVLRIREVS